ncbi:MAG: hypothetical protein AB7D00_04980 [Rhodospirillaceae bacterium]
MTRYAFFTPLLAFAATVVVTGSVMAFAPPVAGGEVAAAKMLPGTGASATCAASTARGPLGY